ncbi:MAG: phytanoyl-CoA dioxygenase family protein [Alphaproteobacteria bacterium]|nr:phytanoyl-CoA dioxygenase family protein [Alphaproteobacteria bacterium]
MPNAMTPDQMAAYDRDGYVIVRGFFDAEETGLLRRAMEEDPAVRDHVIDRRDQEGRSTRIALWNRAGDSIYGLAARCARMVDTAEALLGGEVYHFQSKLTAKDPEVGGAWEWHQDYGYWYYNGCLEPLMFSCMIALDRTTRENGCLQLVKGSHRLGRVDHVPLTKTQNEADPARMKLILERHELVHAELEPGDALFFHCNMLHRSDANRSRDRRWTLLICYNAARNDALRREDDRSYVRLDKVDDGALKAAGLKFATDANAEHFTSKPYVPDVEAVIARKAS